MHAWLDNIESLDVCYSECNEWFDAVQNALIYCYLSINGYTPLW